MFARTPARGTYHIPEFLNILPFTKEEVRIFKEQKIKKVVDFVHGMREVFYLNEEGMPTHSEIVYKKKTKEFVYETSRYRYNERGKLLSLYSSNDDVIGYDSLTYDGLGRVISFFSYKKYISGKRRWRVTEVQADMQLHFSDATTRVLISKLDTNNHVYYTLDNKDEILKVESSNSIDSVSVYWTDPLDFVKRYWYKDSGQFIFRLGAERVYKDSLLRCERTWYENYVPGEKDSLEANQSKFYYDESQRCVLEQNTGVTYGGRQAVVYTYNSIGLPDEWVATNKEEVTFYRRREYWYR